MTDPIDRRQFIRTTGAALAASTLAGKDVSAATEDASTGENRGRIFKAIKLPDFREKISLREKFRLLGEMGFDGVELSSPAGAKRKEEALEASRATGLPIHGSVDNVHWRVRLSDPDAAVRSRGLAVLREAIQETHDVGGSAVLLVPGTARNETTENHDQVRERSMAEIRKALPLAARLGVHILIENVWNRFLYDHDGPDNQTADRLARYIDDINSPWVGVYFDIGNHRKYGKPEEWIRTLGRRIVKLDAKDWGKEKGFCMIGDGDVDWPAVRRALKKIGFTGWATAEVGGGDRQKMQTIADRMNRTLGL